MKMTTVCYLYVLELLCQLNAYIYISPFTNLILSYKDDHPYNPNKVWFVYENYL